MLRSKRSLSGAIAKRTGERFENLIKNIARAEGMGVIQIPSGMKMRRAKGGRLIAQPIRTACDFVIAHKGQCLILDAKIVMASTFPYSKLKSHQLYALNEMSERGGILKSGYLICFSRQNDAKVVFFAVKHLNKVQKGKGLRPEDGFSIGNLYDFSLKKLFE